MVQTRNYRTAVSYAEVTQPIIPVGGVLRLTLPLPPSLNEMLDLAKKRTRRTRNGGFMKRALPVVYDQALERYELEASAALSAAGYNPPKEPWAQWSYERVVFRVFNRRDPVELMASLKWPTDLLVRQKWVHDDSEKELIKVCIPKQTIDRANLGVDVFIRREA